MSVHVSKGRRQEVFKLPGIGIHNRVANAPAGEQKTEPRAPEHRHTQSLPAARRNGFLVTDGQGYDAATHPAHNKVSGDQGPARRQQSLPSRKFEGKQTQRQANSAPSRKNRSQSQKAPLPKVNMLVARSRGPAGETSHIVTTNFAGFSTKDQEASPTRYTRFASTWAQVRAENHIDMCGLASHDDATQASGSSPDRYTSHSTSPQGRGDPASHGPSPDEDDSKPGAMKRKDPAPGISPQQREKPTIRFQPPKDKASDGVQQHGEGPADSGEGQALKSGKKRPEWNNSLAQSVPQQPQEPVKSWKRYEAELTHVPTLTSTKQVYKAYTGHTKQQLTARQYTDSRDDDRSENRPSTRGSQLEEENPESEEFGSRAPKEYILSRNEAKMYLHLQNVYGSGTYRQQRKESFFKRLTDVQVQEQEQQAADRRRKQQQKEESKERQKRQLMHVRHKFRKEQLHRFRTQYVTSRVLEYEQADRDMYGLPADSEDDDVESFDDDDSQESKDEHRQMKDRKDSNPKTPTSNGHPGAKGVQAHSSQSQKVITTNKSKPVASKSRDLVGSTSEPSSKGNSPGDTGRNSSDKENRTESVAAAKKEPGHVKRLPKQNAGKPVVNHTKQSPDTEQAANSDVSKQRENAIGSRSSKEKSPKDSRAEEATWKQKEPSNKAPDSKRDPGQATVAKQPPTTTTSPASPSSPAVTDDRSTRKSTEKAAPVGGKQVHNAPSKDTKTSASAVSGAQKETNTAQPAASPTQNVSKTNSTKAENKPTDRHSGAQGTWSTPGKDDGAGNKNEGLREQKTHSVNGSTHDKVNKDKNDGLPNKQNENTPLKNSNDNNRKPLNQGDKVKNSGMKGPQGKTDPHPMLSSEQTVNGHVSSPNTSSNRLAPNARPASKGAGPLAKSSATRPADSRGRKRKPAQPQPKSEAEQKKQLERKYGKMFDVNTGPSWNPGAKPPKMEGIDTVVIKVTDDKGRTKLKKREVKDVVKEAKAQLKQSDKESRRRPADKGGHSPRQTHDTIRPASADTLDFEDDDDEDEEDVFERVRRKYNIQIDSDDESFLA